MTGFPAAVPSAVVSVDVVILTVRSGRLHVLLVERREDPQWHRWELPGCRKSADESLAACGDRAIERLGVSPDIGHVEQLGTYGDPGRDPRGHAVSVAYLAFVPQVTLPDDAATDVVTRFWAFEDLTDGYGPQLAFDHDRILGDAVERARAKLEYTTLATRFVPDPFTLGDLYDVYRAIWGVDPGDKANFARKVKNTPGFMVRVSGDGEKRNGRGRPSMLYTAGPATNLHPPILRPAPASG